VFFRFVLRWVDAERAHGLVEALMRLWARLPGALWLTDRLLGPRDPGLRVKAMGLELRSPLCVAAGMDKNAKWYAPLAALGFGGIEVGTVTAKPQPGNEGLRIVRLLAERALFNRLGFPGEGAEIVAERLSKRRKGSVIGVNVGKTKVVELDQAVADYRDSVRILAPHADYIALNVSSPNTPGLTELQAVKRLDALIGGVRQELKASGGASAPPLLLKLGPDLADEEIERIAKLALQRQLDGIVAVNTTVDTGGVTMTGMLERCKPKGGGVSGPPLRARSHEVLRLLRRCVGDRIPLISVGGVDSAEDAWQRILAGATLVQAYTAFVYGGPLWPRRLNRGLSRHLRDSPWSSIGEAIGKEDEAVQQPASHTAYGFTLFRSACATSSESGTSSAAASLYRLRKLGLRNPRSISLT
jgi:dihydroorotate dehydrogenase